MIIPNKGLYLDCNPEHQPKGTYRNADHLVFDKSKNIPSKELGVEKFCQNLPTDSNNKVIGKIEIENETVIFIVDTVDNSNDKIGIVDENGYYKNLVVGNLKFKENYQIKGVWTKNDQAQRTIVFTDGINKLRFLNIDNFDENGFSSDTQINKTLEVLSPEFNFTNLTATVKKGGKLKTGLYIPIIRFKSYSGVYTNWVVSDNVFPLKVNNVSNNISTNANKIMDSVGNVSPENSSGKSLNLSFTIDSDFEKVQIGCIAQLEEKTTAKILFETDINNEINISDYDSGTEIDLFKVIAPKLNYKTINDLDIHNDELILASCKDQFEINYQKWANNIKINYNVTELDPLEDIYDDNTIKGFYPDEVYALNIHLELTNGELTKGFHIPGRRYISSLEKDTVSGYDSKFTDAHDYQDRVKKFQIENTCDTVGASTNMGYWENENEFYPNDGNFNSSSLGGEDLRNLNVRHHKFPSLRHLLNEGEITGKTLPLITIDVSNIVIPSELQGVVKGWRISYVKRTNNNSTTLATAPITLNSSVVNNSGYPPKIYPLPLHGKLTDGRISTPYSLRFNAHDILVNKPEMSNVYILNEFRIETSIPSRSIGTYVSNTTGFIKQYSGDHKEYMIVDRLSNVTTISTSSSAEMIAVIDEYKYVACNLYEKGYDNRLGEEHLELKSKSLVSNYIDKSNDVRNGNYNEKTFMSTLKQYKQNVYIGFMEQSSLVLTNKLNEITSFDNPLSETEIGGGDCYVYGFTEIHTAPLTKDEPTNGLDAENPDNRGLGFFVLKRYGTVSTGVITNRYELVGDPQTTNFDKYYGGSDIGRRFFDILDVYDSTQAWNIKYNKDFSFLNELNSLVPFNVNNKTYPNYYNRLHRSNKINTFSEKLTFEFELDQGIYEMPKIRGKIVGLNSFDDRLIIRHELGAYVTSARRSFKSSDGDNITLQDNDLFDLLPQELVTTDNGFIGSSSKFHTLVSEHGTLIIDENANKVFLISKQFAVEEISNLGLKNYFIDNIKTTVNVSVKNFSNIEVESFSGGTKIIFSDYYSLLTDSSDLDFEIGDRIGLSQTNQIKKIKRIELDEDNNLVCYTDHEGINSSLGNTITLFKQVDSPSLFGINLGYDSQYERFLITKKENGLSESNKKNFKGWYSGQTLIVGDIYLANYLVFSQTYEFVRWNGVTFDDITGENVDSNFTISFYPNKEKKFWGSWHSKFIPSFWISLRSKLLSLESNSDTILHKHNSLLKIGVGYNDSSYTFLIEVIENTDPSISKKYYKLFWDTKIIDSDGNVLNNETFDSITLSNSTQNVSETTLTVYVDINNRGNIRRVKSVWKYGKLRTTSGSLKDKKYLTDSYLSVIFKESSLNQLFFNYIDSEFNALNNKH